MDLKINKNHHNMDIKELFERFKIGAFGIAMGLNMALFSGAGVLPPLQAYAAEGKAPKNQDELTDAERKELANLPDEVSFLIVQSINDERKKAGLPGIEEEDITRGDLEKYLKNTFIIVKEDTDLAWLNDCRNIESIDFRLRGPNTTKNFEDVDFSNFNNLRSLSIVRRNIEDEPNPAGFDKTHYGFILDIPNLEELQYLDGTQSPVSQELLSEISNKQGLCGLTMTIRRDPIDYTQIGLNGLERFTIRGSPDTIVMSLTPIELKDMEDRGIKVNIVDASDEDRRERVNEVNRKLEDITNELELRGDLTEKEKRNRIAKYVIVNLTYDPESARRQKEAEELGEDYQEYEDEMERNQELFYKEGVLYGALESDTQICGNYAALFQALAERAGLESYMISSGDHVFNLVKIDGKYVVIDPTAIDGTTITYIFESREQLEASSRKKGTIEETENDVRLIQGAADIFEENPDNPEEYIKWLNVDPSEVLNVPEGDAHYIASLPEGVEIIPLEGEVEADIQHDEETPEVTKTEEAEEIEEVGEAKEKANQKKSTKKEQLYAIKFKNKKVIFIATGATIMGMLVAIAALKANSKRKNRKSGKQNWSEYETMGGQDDDLWMI